MKKKTTLFFIFLLISISSYATVPGGLVTNIPPTARAAGVGNTTIGADDVSNVIKTGAILFAKGTKRIGITNAIMTYGRSYNFIGLEYNSYSLGYVRMAISGIDQSTDGNSVSASLESSENYIVIGKALNKKNMSAGLGLSAYYNKLSSNSATALGTVISFGYKVKPLKLVFSAHNFLATQLKWNTSSKAKDELQKKLILGVSSDIIKKCLVFLESDYIINYGKYGVRGGIEYNIKRYSIRVGFDNTMLTTGFGVNINKFYIDYAFQVGLNEMSFARENQVSNSHKVSIEYKF